MTCTVKMSRADNDFFSLIQPAELDELVTRGRSAMTARLMAIRGNKIETVEHLDVMQNAIGVFDRFGVTTTDDIGEPLKRQFTAMGCVVASNQLRYAVLWVYHTNYDTRWIKVDMSTPQWCMMLVTLVFGCTLIAGGLMIGQ